MIFGTYGIMYVSILFIWRFSDVLYLTSTWRYMYKYSHPGRTTNNLAMLSVPFFPVLLNMFKLWLMTDDIPDGLEIIASTMILFLFRFFPGLLNMFKSYWWLMTMKGKFGAVLKFLLWKRLKFEVWRRSMMCLSLGVWCSPLSVRVLYDNIFIPFFTSLYSSIIINKTKNTREG